MTGTNGASKPIDTVPLGRVQAAIWQNESEKGPFYSVTISRSYRNEDEWRSTQSLGVNDLLVGAKALDIAHTRIIERMAQDRSR